MAHAMMLDLGWESVAARIHGWLEETWIEGADSSRRLPSVRLMRSLDAAERNPG